MVVTSVVVFLYKGSKRDRVVDTIVFYVESQGNGAARMLDVATLHSLPGTYWADGLHCPSSEAVVLENMERR